MRASRLLVSLAGCACMLLSGCTGDDGSQAAAGAGSPSPSAATSDPATAGTTPTPTPTPTQTEAPRIGTGTVTVDGTEMLVSGDCDISREFGEERVGGVAQDLDVVLAVDNVTGDAQHDGAFAMRVQLDGSGPLAERTIWSEGAAGDDGVTLETGYEGGVSRARLDDRVELDYMDVATLHLEAEQQRVRGPKAPPTRALEVDVTCAISRPN